MKPSPFGPGGKITSKDHNEWMPGGFFLVSHSEFKGSMGEGTELSVMGYNSDEKLYTYHPFNSMGEAEASNGTVTPERSRGDQGELHPQGEAGPRSCVSQGMGRQ